MVISFFNNNYLTYFAYGLLDFSDNFEFPCRVRQGNSNSPCIGFKKVRDKKIFQRSSHMHNITSKEIF